MKKIIAAIDFSDITNSVITQAVELKKKFNAELLILHTELAPILLDTEFATPTLLCDALKSMVKSDRDILENIRDLLAQNDIEADTELIEGASAKGIMLVAKEYEADLIVLGSHKHGKLHSLIFGNVRDQLISHSICPILIVPEKNDES